MELSHGYPLEIPRSRHPAPADGGFGVWLSLSGKPYNAILFNIHKLAALATVVVLVIQLYRLLKGTPTQLPPIILVIVVGLCGLVFFFSGTNDERPEKLDYPHVAGR